MTEKRIASAKGLHLICAIVAMVLNVISFVVVAVNVSISEMTFLMFPFALAVLDIIFLVKVILSNYRFAYAVKGAIIHAAVVLVVSAAVYVVMGVLRSSEGIVFVDFAIYAMIAVHVVQSIATAVTALYATKGGKSMRKILGVLFTVVFVAAAGIYGRFLLVEGFFGQGGYGEYRTVVYKYNGDGTYTFTQPAGKVTVKATFMEDNSMLNFFVDVPVDAFYYDAVLWAAKEGITNGTSDTTFSPNAFCNRAQVVTFLWRAAGCPTPQNSEMPFTDVVKGSFYETAVLWAVENGITNGTSATTFSPNTICNRAQFVTFLWRAQGMPDAGMSNPFTDVAEDTFYTDAVLWAAENGITQGTSATTFSPNLLCNRAQAVTFLYRCMGE